MPRRSRSPLVGSSLLEPKIASRLFGVFDDLARIVIAFFGDAFAGFSDFVNIIVVWHFIPPVPCTQSMLTVSKSADKDNQADE